MQMTAPFGDYRLISYEVSCERREITFRTERNEPGEPRHTEVLFNGVMAYHFEYDNFDTILSHIIELPIATFLAEHASQLSAGSTQAGWAPFWDGSVEDASRKLHQASIHAFRITSAMGMRGWVLAQSVKSRVVEM
jgi:hypothetical protein